MSINIKSEEFKNNLYSLINQSQLPIANIYFIYKDVFKDLEEFYKDTINKEIEQEKQANKKELKQEEEQK